MTITSTRSSGTLALIGMVGVLTLAIITRVCVGLFVGEYGDGVPVRIETDRSGLLLEKNAGVTLRGVTVGHVQKIAQRGDGAVLHAEIDPDLIDQVPSDVTAAINAGTVFGPKGVRLESTDNGLAESLQAGAVIKVRRVSEEYNSTFQALLTTLVDLQPVKLNAALSSIADTLDGTGQATGALIHDLHAYLSAFNRNLPALEADIAAVPAVADDYTRITPALVRTLKNGGIIADLLSTQRDDLMSFLTSATVLGNDVTALLVRLEPVLAPALEELRPTLELLEEYSPEIPCLLKGIDVTAGKLRKVMLPPSKGGTHRNVHVQFGVGQSIAPYEFPRDLPKVAATGGPNCRDLPVISKMPNFVRADVGTNPYPKNQDGSELPKTPLGLLLFGEQLPTSPGGKP